MRIRGAIAAINGSVMSVTSRDGQKFDIMLNDPLTVTTVRRVELDSITPGTFIGVATRTGANGELQAIEVLVFPEAMRGASEFQRIDAALVHGSPAQERAIEKLCSGLAGVVAALVSQALDRGHCLIRGNKASAPVWRGGPQGRGLR